MNTLTLSESVNKPVTWDKETALNETALHDPRIKKILLVLNDFENMQKGWKKTKWRKAVAIKHNVDQKTIFNWIKKYKKKIFKAWYIKNLLQILRASGHLKR
jgi:hypothetical protein